jgi:hypothetical protein
MYDLILSIFPSNEDPCSDLSSFPRPPRTPSIRHYRPICRFFLLPIQLRVEPATLAKLQSRHMTPITYALGVTCAREIGAVRYLECSALTQKGLKGVFDEAIRAVLTPGDGESVFLCLSVEVRDVR